MYRDPFFIKSLEKNEAKLRDGLSKAILYKKHKISNKLILVFIKHKIVVAWIIRPNIFNTFIHFTFVF